MILSPSKLGSQFLRYLYKYYLQYILYHHNKLVIINRWNSAIRNSIWSDFANCIMSIVNFQLLVTAIHKYLLNSYRYVFILRCTQCTDSRYELYMFYYTIMTFNCCTNGNICFPVCIHVLRTRNNTNAHHYVEAPAR